MNEDLFVKLEDPEQFRRNVAEGAQEILNIIDIQKRMSYLRTEKQRNIGLVKQNLKDIQKLMNHLESVLPEETKNPKKVKKVKKNSKTKNIEKEIQELDTQIEGIE